MAKTKQSASSAEGKSKKGKGSSKTQDEIKFTTYIAKAHKNMHGSERTVSGAALSTLDMMADHLISTLVTNGRKSMRYSKASTFNKAASAGAAALTLTGTLRGDAIKAADTALSTFEQFNAAAAAEVAAGGRVTQ